MKPWRPLRASSGQAMVEYLIAASLVVALVAVPINGESSAVELLLKAVHAAYTSFLAAISIPI
jgi:hypothetical protein